MTGWVKPLKTLSLLGLCEQQGILGHEFFCGEFTGSSCCLQVLWLNNNVRSFVQAVAPGFQHTMGRKAPIEDLLKHNIVKLNLVYTDMSSEDIQ